MVLNFTVKKSNIHGWGLFADSFISNNTLIEKCTYISTTEPLPSNIYPHIYNNPKGKGSLLIKGYASLLNSSKFPNCSYKVDSDFLIITSIKEIKLGEELTLKYL